MKLLLDTSDGRLAHGIFKVTTITYAESAQRPHHIEGLVLLENEPPALELLIHLPDEPNMPATAQVITVQSIPQDESQ